MPWPGALVVKNGSKIRARSGSGTPGPSSSTSSTARSSTAYVRTNTLPDSPSAWPALTIRFVTTWVSSPAAPRTASAGPSSAWTSIPACRLVRPIFSPARASSLRSRTCGVSPCRLSSRIDETVSWIRRQPSFASLSASRASSSAASSSESASAPESASSAPGSLSAAARASGTSAPRVFT